jgi:hypothetical protein
MDSLGLWNARLLRAPVLAALWLGGSACGSVKANLSDAAVDVNANPPDGPMCAASIDLTNDPSNCGSCGHSCNGGACQSSLCQPVALAIGQHNPHGIAVDATNVYFTTSDGNIVKVPIEGGATTVLASGQVSPADIAVDGTRVYWTTMVTAGQVMSALIAGGGLVTMATSQASPDRIAVANGIAYWTNSAAGTLMKVPLTGGTPVALGTKQTTTGGLALDADTLYWTAGVNVDQQTLFSVSLANAGAVTVICSANDAVRLRVKAGMAYWGNADLGGLYREPVTGGSPTLLSNLKVFAVAVDDRNVYWTDLLGDGISGNIRSIPVAGGTPAILASNQANTSDIAVDDKNIYWTNSVDNGAVLKLAK